MDSVTDLEPLEKSRSFLNARFKSRTDAVGLRLLIELIHKTRFRFAKRCMMCFLLSGSLSQSLLKQMMSRPSIIVFLRGRSLYTAARCRACASRYTAARCRACASLTGQGFAIEALSGSHRPPLQEVRSFIHRRRWIADFTAWRRVR